MTANSRQMKWFYSGVLALLVFGVFFQVKDHPFINYDDMDYAAENFHVYNGLNFHDIAWVFTHHHSSNWHPLTWISHMVDFQLFGHWAGGHHLTSVLLHAFASLFMFAAIYTLTGGLFRSFFAAVLFAIHPLHVESVAWVSERKDVLSGMFFMLTLWAYGKYAERKGGPLRPLLPKGQARRAVPAFYLLTLGLFACGLMSKPMLVTLPFVLLLLDHWPLNRLTQNGWNRCLFEKIPFFLLSAGSVTLTLWAQRGAITPLEYLPLQFRVLNAFVSYAAYLGKTFWPFGLSLFYPYPEGNVSLGKAATGAVIFIFLLIIALRFARRKPYLTVGIFWYVGMLVPVIGIIQVGVQAMAERYTYLPLTGVFLALTWGAADLAEKNKWLGKILKPAAVILILILAVLAWRQTSLWSSEEKLYRHAIKSVARNYHAHYSLGLALNRKGKLEEASQEFQKTLSIQPSHVSAMNAGGLLLARMGNLAEAENVLRRAVMTDPRSYEAHHNLASVYLGREKKDEALFEYKKAVDLKPDYPPAQFRFANALAGNGREEEAIKHYRKAIEIKPDFIMAHYNLAKLLAAKNQINEANDHYMKAVSSRPHSAEAHTDLGIVFQEQDRLPEAEKHLRKAVEEYPNFADAHYALGEVLSRMGNHGEARKHFMRVLEIRPSHAGAKSAIETAPQDGRAAGEVKSG